MSDTILNFDDIFDNQKNPFTNVLTPIKIGLGDRSPERRTVPSTSPYIVKLYHAPIQQVPSVTEIYRVSDNTKLNEVSKGTSPANLQYRVNYDEENVGWVEFNSAQAGQQMDFYYYGQGTIIQKQTFQFLLNTVGATIVLAVSDSESTSKTFADSIIGAGQDAGAVINSYAQVLANGGRIVLMEGTYSIKTIITLANYVTLQGQGRATLLQKAANIENVINISTRVGVSLRDFDCDGVKATYTGANYHNIVGSITDFTSEIHNIHSYNADDYGFSEIYNVSKCRAYNNSTGFYNCFFGNDCFSVDNSLYGYWLCYHFTNSYASGNTTGFFQSNWTVLCRSYANSLRGFESCSNITNSLAYNNTGIGFNSCSVMGFNYSTGNTVAQYNACTSDRAGLLPVADDANGGFNG